jgi:hypothetical protein
VTNLREIRERREKRGEKRERERERGREEEREREERGREERAGTLVAMIFDLGCEYQFSGFCGSNPFFCA